jgi:putative endonuclease
MLEGASLYIVKCADGSYYVGITRGELELRVAQHNAGSFGGYTSTRRPVVLVYSQWFERITDAIENERKIKRWSRAKKQALINGDFALLRSLAKRKTPHRAGLPQAEPSS